MALMTAYLLKTSNLADFFNAIQSAKAPERFTQKFLKDLDFKSSTDRLNIGVIKGLGFIDDGGAPQQRYFDFLDQSNAGRVLAEAIEEAYEDLFSLKTDAYTMDLSDVKGKFKSLTQGQKSDNVIHNMASTFLALCEEADWTKSMPEKPVTESESVKVDEKPREEQINDVDLSPTFKTEGGKMQLHYNIQLILPNSRDQAVFDALFTSLKKHLL